ncbi:MAG: radical SAM protein [Spirochaetales bacterium]|nr:radical SAM protein [Spirochaetales bacterium]
MNYTPQHAVWEITYACNMCCKHCGSVCGEKKPDELTTEEALQLCDDIAAIGLRIMTLSGGEPFVRDDWHQIAKRLVDNGVRTNVISNGWFIDDELIDKAQRAGLSNIGISLDGLKDTHDFIRKKGSFDRIVAAFELMNKRNMPVSVNTSVNKRNIKEIPELKKILINYNVKLWQFQIARPMGNFLKHPDLVMGREQLQEIIDFSYETIQDDSILIQLGDDIGYYDPKQNAVYQHTHKNLKQQACWSGCNAGKTVFGFRANGDITGCLSIRDDSFIEGNVRDIRLTALWTRPKAFSWNRDMTKETLTGFCAKCRYNRYCLGGCSGSKLTFCHSLSENTYCSYRVLIEKEEEEIKKLTTPQELMQLGKKYLDTQSLQCAEICFSHALGMEPENTYIIDTLGYIHFFLDNYETSFEYNEKALKLNPKNAYAWHGLGLCHSRLGRYKEGVVCMTKAIQLSKQADSDYYLDLAIILDEHGKTKDAVRILEKIRKISTRFKEKSGDLYQSLKKKKERVKG